MDEVTVVVPGRPVPKGRPRLGTRVFTPDRTREFEERVAWYCRAARVRLRDRVVEVTIELHTRTPLRGDIDNYAKAVLDGLQKGEAIADDRQVASLRCWRVVGDAEEDRTVIVLKPLAEAAA